MLFDPDQSEFEYESRTYGRSGGDVINGQPKSGEGKLVESRFGVALETYRTVRDESLGAILAQTTTFRYGVIGVGIVIGFGLKLTDRALALATLALGAPIATNLFVLIWMGEIERMIRAGIFLQQIERRVNDAFAASGVTLPAPLSWEHWLAQHPELRLRRYYHSLLAVALLLSLLSVVLAFLQVSRQPKVAERDIAIAIAVCSIGTILTVFPLWTFLRTERRLMRAATTAT